MIPNPCLFQNMFNTSIYDIDICGCRIKGKKHIYKSYRMLIDSIDIKSIRTFVGVISRRTHTTDDILAKLEKLYYTFTPTQEQMATLSLLFQEYEYIYDINCFCVTLIFSVCMHCLNIRKAMNDLITARTASGLVAYFSTYTSQFPPLAAALALAPSNINSLPREQQVDFFVNAVGAIFSPLIHFDEVARTITLNQPSGYYFQKV